MARSALTATSSPPGTATTRQSLSRGALAPSRDSSKPPSTGHSTGDQLSLASTEDGDDEEVVEYFLAGSSSDESDPELSTTPTTSSILKRNSKHSSSSLVRFLSKKLGRTFNKKAGFRGRAFLPNDQIERERNILQHQLFLDVLDGRLFLNPIKNPKRILDVGTGPGLWCLEIGQRYPEAQVLGIDVDPVRPPYSLPNCQFRMQDASEPWESDEMFDFIHQRMVGELPCGKAMLFDWMYDHLNPGGWIEITEWLVKFQSPNHSLRYFNQWNENFRQGLRTFGSSPEWSLMWRPVMEKKGAQHITERKHPVPLNTWPPGKRLQRQGEMMAENVQIFLEGATMPIFTGALGWPAEKVQKLLVNLRKEVADPTVHGFLILNTVYCQKPREGSSVSSIRSQQRPSTSSLLTDPGSKR